MNILFFLGFFIFLYSTADLFVRQHLQTSSLLFGVIGLLLEIWSVIRLSHKYSKAFQFHQWKKFGFIFSIVIIFGTGVVFLNSLAVHSQIRFDLTSNKQHTLSNNTQKFVESLESKVNITAFYVGLPPKYLQDMLGEYERLSKGMISTEIVDPIENIGYAAQFGSVINGKVRKVIVRSEFGEREYDFTEKPLNEEELTNTIMRVVRRARSAYFLAGHNERDPFDRSESGFQEFAKLLLANNIIAKRLLLAEIEVFPEDCDLLIIAGPQEHFSEAEQVKLLRYLAEGGDAVFLIESIIVTTPDIPLTEDQKTKNPSLNEILNFWGIQVYDDIVVDLSSHASGDVGSPATKNYMPHKSIVEGLDYTFYVRPRSVSIVSNRPKQVKVAPLLATMSEESSWGETDRELKVKFTEGVDRAGPVPFGAVAWEPKVGEKQSETRLVVVTDADFLSNAYLASYSNAQMGLNIVNWVSELDYKLFLNKKKTEVPILELTSRQKRLVIVLLCVIPLFIFFVGVSVWLKLKNSNS